MMDLRTLRSEIYKLSELVEGWSAPEYIPKIERDLALEKLRALYDMVRFAAQGAEPTVVPEPVAKTEVISVPEPEAEVILEPAPEVISVSEPGVISEPVSEEISVPEPEVISEPALEEISVPQPEEISVPEPEPAPAPETVPAKDAEPAPEVFVPVSAPTLFGLDSDESEAEKLRHRHKQRVIMSLYGSEPERPAVEPLRRERPVLEIERPVIEIERPAFESEVSDFEIEEPSQNTEAEQFFEAPKMPEAAAAQEEDFIFEEISLSQNTVLGEVINPDVQTLADTFAKRGNAAPEIGLADHGSDLRQSIGLNDKFLLIRDLFNGDGAACEQALEILNGFDNLDDCMIYIAENYAWNPNSDGAKFMMELIERKYA